MSPYFAIYLNILAHRPREAIAIAWWWATRRRVRAAGRFRAAAARSSSPAIYRYWLAITEHASSGALDWRDDSSCPRLMVHLHRSATRDGAEWARAIQSVLDQRFENWTLAITSGSHEALPDDPRIVQVGGAIESRAAGLDAVLQCTDADYVVPLDADATLAPGALRAYARAVAVEAPGDPAVFYGDQDERGPKGERRNPWLKPQWDADLFVAQDYLSAACAIPVEAVRKVGTDVAVADAVLIYALLAKLLVVKQHLIAIHVPYVTTTTAAGNWSRDISQRAEFVRSAIAEPIGALLDRGPFGTLFLRRRLPDPPPGVSIVVPTRDRLDLLSCCVEGVLHGTDYPDVELVIADNGSVEPATLAFFDACARDPRVKVVRWPYPYNYSAINNFAVRHTSRPYVCLLNNDIEMIDLSWLRAMMAHAIRPEVGAVGARLLYPDHSIQHAGVVIGLGNAAGHAHRGLPAGQPGYFGQALVTRAATAVTAACLVVAREKFDAVSGLDEEGLAIAYNDVDFCLKLGNAGFRNIYVAEAVLIHHESKSRGQDFAEENLARYLRELKILQQRWSTVGFCDPTHHRSLDPASETFRLKV